MSIRNSHVNQISFSKIICLTLFIVAAGCGIDHSSEQKTGLSSEDIVQIRAINKTYTQGWMDADEEKVLGLYAESAVINPSGLLPKEGKKAITDFWFPNDSSSTIVHSYTIDIIDLQGSGNLAYSYEHGRLSFTYKKDDFQLDRTADSYAVTIYEKDSLGSWKIINRIWTDMKD